MDLEIFKIIGFFVLVMICIYIGEFVWQWLIKHIRFFKWLNKSEYEDTIDKLNIPKE